MANLSSYRSNYTRYQSSEEILAAIDEMAADCLPCDDTNDAAQTDAERLWTNPTNEEQAKIIARAWALAAANSDELYWGQLTIHRPQ